MVSSTALDPAALRSPGRPRSAEAEQAILKAALELLADCGINGLTVEGVAARAGVGKATIYRRYPTKADLVLGALSMLNDEIRPLTCRSVRDDLVTLVDAQRKRASSTLAGQILPRLIGDAPDNPEIMERYRNRTIQPRRNLMLGVLQRGVEEGIIRPDIDPEDVCDMLVGPILNRILKCGAAGVGGKDYAALVVDTVLRGIAP